MMYHDPYSAGRQTPDDSGQQCRTSNANVSARVPKNGRETAGMASCGFRYRGLRNHRVVGAEATRLTAP